MDLSKVKAGDEVTVRAIVLHVLEGDEPVVVVGISDNRGRPQDHGTVYGGVDPDDIVTHTPKALSVGDRVTLASGGTGYVRAIVGERAWVDLVDAPDDMMNGCAYGLSYLERA